MTTNLANLIHKLASGKYLIIHAN